MKLENFNIFPNTRKEKPNHPDYEISFKGEAGYEKIGACWKKTGTSGTFLSCSINKEYVVTITNPAIEADAVLKKEAETIDKKEETIAYPVNDLGDPKF